MNSSKESSYEERRRKIKKVVERVKEALNLSSKDYVVIEFPIRYKERSIDIVALDNEGHNMVIRIKPSITLSKEEIEDLVEASLALDAIPLMVSEDENLYDNIVYEREGIYVLNERTLENICLRPTELIALYRKGDLYVSLNSKAFKELKTIKKYTLSDLSFRTGISRRTLFDYEREDSIISIDVAERLVEVLGEDVVKTINLKIMRREFIRKISKIRTSKGRLSKLSILNRKLRMLIKDRNIESIHYLRKSAPDYIIKDEEKSFETIVDTTAKKYTLREVIKKIMETVKITDLINGKTNVIVNRDRSKVLIDELSTQISINKLDIMKINE